MEKRKKKMKLINLMIIDDLVYYTRAYALTLSALLHNMLDNHTVVGRTINSLQSILFGICCSLSSRTTEDFNGSLSRYLKDSIILNHFLRI